jgi:outer membrane protein assembly factor BamA
MRPPSGLGAKRRLTDEDVARKNDGFYLTGLPLFAYDPLIGFGGGVRVYAYYDGKRDDPLFAYTPYLHRVYAQIFAGTGGVQDHIVDYDAPAFPDPSYRVRITAEYEADTDWPYFGIGSRTLAPLSFPGTAPGTTFAKMGDYKNATSAVQADGTTYARYNVYGIQRPLLQLALERNLLGGALRTMIGTNITHADLHDYTGQTTSATDASGHQVSVPEAQTLLARDCAAGLVVGCAGGWDNVLRTAISLDTRDFEPDPNDGVYAELSGEFGTKLLGSQYEYMRLMLSVRGFYSPIPKLADLVIAARGVYEIQTKGTPFFSATLMPFVDDNHAGLGGLRSLRGYLQNRFVGPDLVLGNFELRWTFVKFRVLKQGIALIGVPFVDVGRVFDNVSQTTLSGWKRSQGAGLRIAWNEATIIMIDYGFSDEDDGLYLNFNHIF